MWKSCLCSPPTVVKSQINEKAYCPKCGAELKDPKAEICPSSGVRIKAVPKPPGADPCGCGTVFVILFLASLPFFSLYLSKPQTYPDYFFCGLFSLGAGIFLFAVTRGWIKLW